MEDQDTGCAGEERSTGAYLKRILYAGVAGAVFCGSIAGFCESGSKPINHFSMLTFQRRPKFLLRGHP